MKKIVLLALIAVAGLSLVSGARSADPCPPVTISDVPPPDCAPDCSSFR